MSISKIITSLVAKNVLNKINVPNNMNVLNKNVPIGNPNYYKSNMNNNTLYNSPEYSAEIDGLAKVFSPIPNPDTRNIAGFVAEDLNINDLNEKAPYPLCYAATDDILVS